MEFYSTKLSDIFNHCFCFERRSFSEICLSEGTGYVKRVIKTREEAETVDDKGNVPIFSAVKSGNVGTVSYLFVLGVLYIRELENNWNILHEAVSSRSIDMVVYIMKKCSIPPNSMTKDGVSPLHIAVFNGDVEILRVLLEYTKNNMVSPRGKDGLTPLMIASKNGDRVMMKLLYEAGASFFEKDMYGKNSISYSKDSRTLDVVYSLNVCLMDERYGVQRSAPIFIDTIQSKRAQRKKMFFGIR